MLPKLFKSICFGILMIFTGSLTSCVNMDIFADYDSSNDFTRYRTFAWSIPDKRYSHVDQNFDNDIIEGNIVNYTHNELYARGYRIDTLNPDIVLSFQIVTQNKVRVDQVPVTRQVYNNPRPYYYTGYNAGYVNNYNQFGGNGYNQNMAMGGGGGGYYTTVTDWKSVNVNYEEGTLIITVTDRAKNRVVWRANAVGTLDDPSTFEAELPEDIKLMFKKYPIAPLKDKKKSSEQDGY